ncbi:hypothetical protein BRC81_09335 [Halobacteriales archaeon QS_1_68_20]|nr:MAG: hypothetical protein BRC81_09335 [Halobacteriales archaeon QS_1_68_20]
MGAADEQIRVSNRVKLELDRRRRDGESYNDVLERVLDEDDGGDFYAGFGRWSAEEAERVREQRRTAKEKRKRRMEKLSTEDA